MNREKLQLTKEQGREIIWGNNKEFEVIYKNIVGQRRWVTEYEVLVKRLSDGKFFRDYFEMGSTEIQEEAPYTYEDPNFREVFPVEKTITVYK